MRLAEGGGGGVEVVERVDVDPKLRHRDDEVGPAEPHRSKLLNRGVDVGEFLVHKVRSGDAQMDPPRRQFARDLTGAQKHQLQPLDPVDAARVFALGPVLGKAKATGAEPLEGFFHEPPLGRHAELDRHACPLS